MLLRLALVYFSCISRKQQNLKILTSFCCEFAEKFSPRRLLVDVVAEAVLRLLLVLGADGDISIHRLNLSLILLSNEA